MRIVIGNAPQAYRDCLAAALDALRPGIEVISVAPEDLDAAVARLGPDFVICSELSEIVETRPAGWAVLYPGGAGTSLITIHGTRSVLRDVHLEALLESVDQLSA